MAAPQIKIVDNQPSASAIARAHRSNQGQAASDLIQDLYGKQFFEDNNDAYQLVWRLTRFYNDYATAQDMHMLVQVYQEYLCETLPAFLALEGEFSYKPGGNLIQTEDGQKFVERYEAALHCLELAFKRLWDGTVFSVRGKCAITNSTVNSVTGEPNHPDMYSYWRFNSALMSLNSLGYRAKREPGVAERKAHDMFVILREAYKTAPATS